MFRARGTVDKLHGITRQVLIATTSFFHSKTVVYSRKQLLTREVLILQNDILHASRRKRKKYYNILKYDWDKLNELTLGSQDLPPLDQSAAKLCVHTIAGDSPN